jgi:hypothetical protein
MIVKSDQDLTGSRSFSYIDQKVWIRIAPLDTFRITNGRFVKWIEKSRGTGDVALNAAFFGTLPSACRLTDLNIGGVDGFGFIIMLLNMVSWQVCLKEPVVVFLISVFVIGVIHDEVGGLHSRGLPPVVPILHRKGVMNTENHRTSFHT